MERAAGSGDTELRETDNSIFACQLPILYIVDCRLPIFDLKTLREIGLDRQSAIGNRQSAMPCSIVAVRLFEGIES